MSFNAFFYFCTEFELFPKHAPLGRVGILMTSAGL